MDGNTLSQDPQSAEAMRQREVTEAAMKSLEWEARRRDAAGYAVMAAVMSLEDAADKSTGLGKVAHFAQLACILFAFATPCYLFWSLVLAG
jgi:hypothetical protein